MGRRIAIVHHGESIPFDSDYRPMRYGRLARFLTESGMHVTRLCPTYSWGRDSFRPTTWNGRQSDEGEVALIDTRAYRPRDASRIGFIRDLNIGSRHFFRANPGFDLVIAGYPPPGLVRSIRKGAGASTPILADIRDLWPDALASANPRSGPMNAALKYAGRLLASELHLADGVVGLSETMLARAPKRRRRGVIPIGLPLDCSDFEAAWPSPQTPIRFVFLGSLSALFDFASLIDGWARFQNESTLARSCELHFYGAGPRESELAALVKGVPAIHRMGWLDTNEVFERLAGYDVGLSPTRSGQGTTLGNKVFEYLAVGLYVLNSLEPENAAILEEQGCGRGVRATPRDWSEGFHDCVARVAELRADRAARIQIARANFGLDQLHRSWLELIEKVALVSTPKKQSR